MDDGFAEQKEGHMRDFSRHITAAQGFVDLGMFLDANGELEEIRPEMRDRSEVLAVRVRIYRALENWDLMDTVAGTLALRHPDNDQLVVDWAFARRRSQSPEAAFFILQEAERNHPAGNRIQYELARYECETGAIETARQRLKQLFERDPAWRTTMIDDPAFERIWDCAT